MKKVLIISFIAFFAVSCEQKETSERIDALSEYVFEGNYVIAGKQVTGTLLLTMVDGKYFCTTDQPYGRGAGRLYTDKDQILFTDTLFFPVPALYGPSWVLSGAYQYTFDGSLLELNQKLDSGNITYELVKTY